MRNFFIVCVTLLLAIPGMAQVDRSHAPDADLPEKLSIGKLIPIELKNGVQVYLAPVSAYPKFTISVNIEHPSIYEDERSEEKGILGMAYTNRLSEKYPNGEIDSIVKVKGAMLSVTNHGGTIKGMKRDMDQLMDMYSDLLLHPLIREEYIQQKKDDFKASQQRKGADKSKAKNDFSAISIADSLLHGAVENNEKKKIRQNYDSIHLGLVEEFLKERIIANNAVIVVIGDFTENEVQKYMTTYLGNWQEGEAIVREKTLKSTVPIIQNRRIIVVDKPLAVQSRVSFKWNLKDAYSYGENSIKLEVLNELFGESSSSYLFMNLREEKGLCYFIRSSISPSDAGGSGEIWTSVRTDQTAYAIENILYEMLRIRNCEVSDQDLKVAKSSLIGEFTRALSGISTIPYISFAMEKEVYHLPDDYLQTKVSKYYALTKDDMSEMAKKYIDPFQCVIVVTGKADEIKGSLERFGQVEYYTEDGEEYIFN